MKWHKGTYHAVGPSWLVSDAIGPVWWNRPIRKGQIDVSKVVKWVESAIEGCARSEVQHGGLKGRNRWRDTARCLGVNE